MNAPPRSGGYVRRHPTSRSTIDFTVRWHEPLACKTELEPRYRRLFDDVPIHSTYLSFDRGNRFERNGRMVVYGLTGAEADTVCQTIKANFERRYDGTVSCVIGRET